MPKLLLCILLAAFFFPSFAPASEIGQTAFGVGINPIAVAASFNSSRPTYGSDLFTAHPYGEMDLYAKTTFWADIQMQLTYGRSRTSADTVAITFFSPRLTILQDSQTELRAMLGLNKSWVRPYAIYMKGSQPEQYEYGDSAEASSVFVGPQFTRTVNDHWAVVVCGGLIYNYNLSISNKATGALPPEKSDYYGSTGHELRGRATDVFANVAIEFRP